MAQTLKCPYCGSTNVTRMDGSGVVSKLGKRVMVDIAPDIVLCNDCHQDFSAPLFDEEIAIPD
ncbi:MAG: hypothetical protein IKC52_05410 [Clostridia bacterium]|nr:hypothetical protein [Clostridia bacterium]